MVSTPKFRSNRTRRTAAEERRNIRKRVFLKALNKRGFVTHACEETGIPRTTVYDWYDQDEVFAARWDEAIEISTERAESELLRRGVEGYDHPVTYEGQITDTYKKYSDGCLRLLLQSRKPDRYRERQDIRHQGDAELRIIYDLPVADSDLPPGGNGNGR